MNPRTRINVIWVERWGLGQWLVLFDLHRFMRSVKRMKVVGGGSMWIDETTGRRLSRRLSRRVETTFAHKDRCWPLSVLELDKAEEAWLGQHDVPD